MELYYCKPDDISETLLTVDNFETNHIVKTMRKRVGDALDITDGCGNHYQGTISATKPVVNVKINRVIKKGKKGPDVYLGMAFIRPNRLEIVLEKCTELGISTFWKMCRG